MVLTGLVFLGGGLGSALRHGANPAAAQLLDRLLHHAVVVQIESATYHLRAHADLMPVPARAHAAIAPPPSPKRRG